MKSCIGIAVKELHRSSLGERHRRPRPHAVVDGRVFRLEELEEDGGEGKHPLSPFFQTPGKCHWDKVPTRDHQRFEKKL
jgi:hypothetical protein